MYFQHRNSRNSDVENTILVTLTQLNWKMISLVILDLKLYLGLIFLSRNCWQNYVDFHRCHKVKGDDYEPCDYFKRIYSSLCPNEWVSIGKIYGFEATCLSSCLSYRKTTLRLL